MADGGKDTTIVKEAYGLRRRLREMLGCDYRSLACCRILLSLLLLWDVHVRWLDLDAFYTDNGLLPTPAVIGFQRESGWDFPSIHYASGSAWFQEWLFLITAGVFFMLLIGWRTRIATIAAWGLLTSLHNRQGMNLNGGDLLVRLVLFWACFLPWGRVWSIDSFALPRVERRKGDLMASAGQTVTSAATVALLVQLASMYMFSYGLKTGVTWRNGSALALALQNEQFLTAFGKWLRGILFPSAFLAGIGQSRFNLMSEWMADWSMRLSTWMTLYIEMAGPLLLCSPVMTQHLRIAMVIVFIGLHAGFGLCLNIGLFMWIPMACATAFLPSLFWNALLDCFIPKIMGYEDRQLVVYSETGAAATLSRLPFAWCQPFLLHGHCYVAKEIPPTVQLERQQPGRLMSARVVDRSTGRVMSTHVGADALAQVLRRCPLLLPLWLFSKAPLLSNLFTWVAGFWLHEPESDIGKPLYAILTYFAICFTSLPERSQKRPMKARFGRLESYVRLVGQVGVTILVTLLIVFCFRWNWASLAEDDMSYSSARVAELLRLDQWWGMFSPNPPFETGWFVIPGLLADGRMVDLMPGSSTPWQPPSYEKPTMPSYQYPSQRWRKYLMNLHDVEHFDKRAHFGHYLCKKWNWPTGPNYGDDKLVTFELLFFGVDLEPDLRVPQAEPSGVSLWSHLC